MSGISRKDMRDIEDNKSGKLAYYHREYKHDLEHVDSSNYYMQQAKRVGLVALPFISFYKPAGTALSVVMNSTRTLSSFAQTYQAFCKGDVNEIGLALFNTFISMSSVAGTLFKSSYGMVITSSHDVLLNLYHVMGHIQTGNYQAAFEEFKSLTNNSLYLALLVNGSLEILVASMAIQVLLGLNNSYKEFSKGNYLEGFGHLGMSGIRGYQLQPNIKMLQFKWDLQKVLKEQMKNTSNMLSAPLNISSETAITAGAVGGAVSGVALASGVSVNLQTLDGITQQILDESLLTMWSKIKLQLPDIEGLPYTVETVRSWINDPSNKNLIESITNLNFHGLNLKIIPPEIGNFTELKTLRLSHNNLTFLPPEIGQLKKLECLYLQGNNLTSLPKEIGDCKSLSRLYLRLNNLSSFPMEMEKLNLVYLDFGHNKFTSFPEVLKSLKPFKTDKFLQILFEDNPFAPYHQYRGESFYELKKIADEIGLYVMMDADYGHVIGFWTIKNPVIYP